MKYKRYDFLYDVTLAASVTWSNRRRVTDKTQLPLKSIRYTNKKDKANYIHFYMDKAKIINKIEYNKIHRAL